MNTCIPWEIVASVSSWSEMCQRPPKKLLEQFLMRFLIAHVSASAAIYFPTAGRKTQIWQDCVSLPLRTTLKSHRSALCAFFLHSAFLFFFFQDKKGLVAVHAKINSEASFVVSGYVQEESYWHCFIRSLCSKVVNEWNNLTAKCDYMPHVAY